MESSTAIYLRVSTDRQGKGLESQERALRAYLESKGTTHYVIYKDENQSGAKSSRPELDRMLEAVRRGQHSIVVVYSFSRFARSTQHLLEALEEFRSLGVTFVSLTEAVDTESPMGRAMFTIISALGQLERELISERVKNGLVNAKAKGKKLGAPLRRNCKLIRQLALEGYSQREIADLVPCSKSTVQRELANTTPE